MDTTSSTYRLLELIAISGECSPEAVNRLGISSSYCSKLITRLKEDGYIKTHYKERLRGYRLTGKGKNLLIGENPERFIFFLSGNTETNRPRSEFPRRLRLQQASLLYVLLQNAGIFFFRDQKPPVFQTGNNEVLSLPLPVYYHSREIKELGAETIKINNSRLMGILLAPQCIYCVYYTGGSLMKWEYRTELKVRALLMHHLSQGILSHGHILPWYHSGTPIRALLIGSTMEVSVKMLTSTGGYRKSYFYLDSSFDCFHFVPDTAAGAVMLRLLCSPSLLTELKQVLLSDLLPPCHELGFEHDALGDGVPVLLAYDFDMLRISRFHTALSLNRLIGRLYCFDFQVESLQMFFGDTVTVTSIDLAQFERRFL